MRLSQAVALGDVPKVARVGASARVSSCRLIFVLSFRHGQEGAKIAA
jgi:hypothetical protein